MTIHFNGVRIVAAAGGGSGGVSWPGDGTKLLSGDGSQVVVGDGLSLSAGTLTSTVPSSTYIATIGDPLVPLLLRMDGANNSTTFTDESIVSRTITAFGNAKISTAQSKFGGASAAFDGNGDYLRWDSTADLAVGSSDFTIEGWVYLNVVGYQTIFMKHTSGVASDIGLNINNSTSLLIGYNNTVGGIIRTVPTILANTWYHFAMVGSSGSLKVYWNGTQAGASISYSSINNGATYWTIGSENWNSPTAFLNGYIDQFRITKGLARYTSDFTPPNSAFPRVDGAAELPANPTVGDMVYSDYGVYACSSASPVVWKKFDAAPSRTISI